MAEVGLLEHLLPVQTPPGPVVPGTIIFLVVVMVEAAAGQMAQMVWAELEVLADSQVEGQVAEVART